jgi:hypothetical protein
MNRVRAVPSSPITAPTRHPADTELVEEHCIAGLMQAPAQVPDPRSHLGRRFALPALAMPGLIAVPGAARSFAAIAQHSTQLPDQVPQAAGVRRRRGHHRPPAAGTPQRVFHRLDADQSDAAPGRCIAAPPRDPADQHSQDPAARLRDPRQVPARQTDLPDPTHHRAHARHGPERRAGPRRDQPRTARRHRRRPGRPHPRPMVDRSHPPRTRHHLRRRPLPGTHRQPTPSHRHPAQHHYQPPATQQLDEDRGSQPAPRGTSPRHTATPTSQPTRTHEPLVTTRPRAPRPKKRGSGDGTRQWLWSPTDATHPAV